MELKMKTCFETLYSKIMEGKMVSRARKSFSSLKVDQHLLKSEKAQKAMRRKIILSRPKLRKIAKLQLMVSLQHIDVLLESYQMLAHIDLLNSQPTSVSFRIKAHYYIDGRRTRTVIIRNVKGNLRIYRDKLS